MKYTKLPFLFLIFILNICFSYAPTTQDGKQQQVKKVLPALRKNFIFTVNGVNIEMIFVEGGSFLMGCTSEQSDCYNSEKPTHNVSLSDFYMGKYIVTQKLWYAVMGTTIQQQRDLSDRNSLCGEGDDFPMYYVNYTECEEFCTKLTQLLSNQLPENYTFKLPTEAQWEYAARGGKRSNGYKFSGGNNVSNLAWNVDNSGKATHLVGKKMPNELGIYDMSGNIWEWCRDWYDVNYYAVSSPIDPEGPVSGTARAMRGGAWNEAEARCRVSNRSSSACYRLNRVGFRICLSL